jgi:hypothetical protein
MDQDSVLFTGFYVLIGGTIAMVETLGTPIFLNVYHPSNEAEGQQWVVSVLLDQLEKLSFLSLQG